MGESNSNYLLGTEGMKEFFHTCPDPLTTFKRNLYSKEFNKVYEKNIPTLQAIEECYNTVIDKEQCMENMARALVEEARTQIDECQKNSAKKKLQMDINMMMVAYILPAVLEFGGESSELLAEKICAVYKETFPKENIKSATFESIEKGFHRKFCYITTAVCQQQNKADDCYELTLLRDYRDNYLAKQDGGEALIDMYYDVAPSIVKHINQHENAEEIYDEIFHDYISPCISMIEHKQMTSCAKKYQEMVLGLKKRFFYYQ